MGYRTSHGKVIASKWWEVKAHEILRATQNTGDVEEICSLLPIEDAVTAIRLLKERPDLDMLFALYCTKQDLSKEQRADPDGLTIEFKANELWRKFRMPPGHSESPWDWNWQPRLTGAASEIADEFHVAVCRAVFRVPFLDFVSWALGSNALFVESLLNAVRDVRDRLQNAMLDAPGMKDMYVAVEKLLGMRNSELAYWIVASSLSSSSYPLEDTLASIRDPIRNLFATRDLKLVLERLPVFDQRFQHINQKYNWSEWSMDLDFWDRTH